MNSYKIVIGLEIHVELLTETKIFCGCKASFGEKPNTNCCPTCLGLPGSLPALNEKVVELAIKAGLALDSEVTLESHFDRKNYFYPDLPKAYQISQLYAPICTNGHVDISVGDTNKRIRITELHMEEDAGKLIHDENSSKTIVDYNRAGVPLIEIVTAPDFESSDEVIAFLNKLKDILQYIEVSDCRIEEGSMRVDVNLSVCPLDSEVLGTRTEMKNLASFKAISKAIEYESKRQIELVSDGGTVFQETRRFDEEKEITIGMRSKETYDDYKYFPEPDLPYIITDINGVECIKNNLPELRGSRIERYIRDYGLSLYEAETLTTTKHLSEVFEEIGKVSGSFKEASNFVLTDLLKLISDVNSFEVNTTYLGKVIELLLENKINRSVAKTVFSKVVTDEVNPVDYISENNLFLITDEKTIQEGINKILSDNKKALEEYLNGKEKNFQFFIGQSMRAFGGKAEPKVVTKILQKLLSEKKNNV